MAERNPRHRDHGWHFRIVQLAAGDCLGQALAIKQLEFSWPSGERQVLFDLPSDRGLHIREGNDSWPEVAGPRATRPGEENLAHASLKS